MVDKEDIKEKTREIYQVLPKLDDQRCGYKTCGEFARAVADGRAPCYGCISDGSEVTDKVCEIMGARVHDEAILQFGLSPRFYQPRLTGYRGMGKGKGRGPGRGRGMGPSRGMKGSSMGQGFG